VRIGDDGGNVVQRYLPEFLAFAYRVLHHHETAMQEQMPPVVGHFDDAADHSSYSLKPGSRVRRWGRW
jgi:hypothetical protein